MCLRFSTYGFAKFSHCPSRSFVVFYHSHLFFPGGHCIFIYKKRVISTVKEIKQSDDDKQEAFRKKGGVSLWLGVLGYWAVGQLPTIIALTSGMLR